MTHAEAVDRVGLRDVLDELGLAVTDVAELAATVRQLVSAEVDAVIAEAADDARDDATAAIPQIDLADVTDLRGHVADRIRRRGCVIVRNTFDVDQATDWDRQIGDYLARNRFEELEAARDPEAAATGSRIWSIYWSRPQVEARQHDRMDAVRRALNSLWRHRSSDDPGAGIGDGRVWFDPHHDIAYPDRIRRRAPGVTARGLPPHIDAPSTGGWRVAENRAVFADVLAGNPDAYDPFDAAHRTSTEVESPVGCSVFRTFQGWTALSETRPSDGGLSIVPIPSAAAHLLVSGIARELGVDGPAEPAPRRAARDPLLERALVPVPTVRPGDTVWWHGDLVHAVGAARNDLRWSNVMYIGVAPRCPRNDAYLATAYGRFVEGRSPVDFPAHDIEVSFVGRATPADLDERGRRQFGLVA